MEDRPRLRIPNLRAATYLVSEMLIRLVDLAELEPGGQGAAALDFSLRTGWAGYFILPAEQAVAPGALALLGQAAMGFSQVAVAVAAVALPEAKAAVAAAGLLS